MADDRSSAFLDLDAASRAQQLQAVDGEPSRDPICGMEIVPSKATGQSEHQGRVYFFCSDACQRQFDTIVGLRTAMGTVESVDEATPAQRAEPLQL